ncbi:hypothetical protein J5X84_38125 [Streptosporangiaceae bacterium NEAU-GS5]|nr:hypothetical protein [Streptosporangiaceae bacterium NEAU-GS5]
MSLPDRGQTGLWDIAAEKVTDAEELCLLGERAMVRGLYRRAAGLWTRAVVAGSAEAGCKLLGFLPAIGQDSTPAAQWVAAHVPLDDMEEVMSLLPAMAATETREDDGWPDAYSVVHDPEKIPDGPDQADGEATGAVFVLADRIAAGLALNDASNVAAVLGTLRHVRTYGAATALLRRDPARHVDLGEPRGVAALLGTLRRARQHAQLAALLSRDPAGHVAMDDPGGVAWLLQILRDCGADDAAARLLARDPARTARLDRYGVAGLLEELHAAGDHAATAVLADRAVAMPLGDPDEAFAALECLHKVATHPAAGALASRIVADLKLDDPFEVACGLESLGRMGRHAEQAVLARRAVDGVPIGHHGVAWLLRSLHQLELHDHLRDLLARDPGGNLALDDPYHVDLMLLALRRVGARGAARELARRAAEQAPAHQLRHVHYLLIRLRKMRMLDQARLYGGRVAAEVSLAGSLECEAEDLDQLVGELRKIDAGDAADLLIRRATDAGVFWGFLQTRTPTDRERYRHGREPDGAPSPPWSWSAPR